MNAEIRQLESEAEAARVKLAADIAVLRSPATYSEFKDGLKLEALDARDAVVESVRSNVKSTAEIWIDEIKAKAAANPGAALLIGAGVAWRLLQNPPIATALVGAGLFSLLRTSPERRDRPMTDEEYLEQAKYRLKEQASDLALGAKERAVDLAGNARARAVDIAESAKERALGIAGSVSAQAQELSDAAQTKAIDIQNSATGKVEEWREAAAETAQSFGTQVQNQIGNAAGRTTEAVNGAANAARQTRDRVAADISTTADYSKTAAGNGYAAARRVARDAIGEQNRDKVLLGAAGIAVTAALTLALQRKMST